MRRARHGLSARSGRHRSDRGRSWRPDRQDGRGRRAVGVSLHCCRGRVRSISVEPIGSRRSPISMAARSKKAPPESGAYALAGSGGDGGWGTEPAMQANNAQGPSWFHRRPKGSICLIAGNRRRPSGIGAVGRSLSAALWAGRGATPGAANIPKSALPRSTQRSDNRRSPAGIEI